MQYQTGECGGPPLEAQQSDNRPEWQLKRWKLGIDEGEEQPMVHNSTCKNRPPSRRWKINTGTAGVVLFALSLGGLASIYQIICSRQNDLVSMRASFEVDGTATVAADAGGKWI